MFDNNLKPWLLEINGNPSLNIQHKLEEGKKVLKVMADNGLPQGKNGLRVYVMCEIPSNVLLAEEFAEIFA